jgi:tRNA-Thr(GGU) m(6)t(6)A37 methyltransferase TsaA
MPDSDFTLRPIGYVRSTLQRREEAPRQGSEGAPDAWVEFDPAFADAAADLHAGDDLILLTWFHQGRRDTQKVHPRNIPGRPLTGVFSTRSPDRPNPIGLHRVTVREVEQNRLHVEPLEAIDGTPVDDINPVFGATDDF